jgi:hypothetical protein
MSGKAATHNTGQSECLRLPGIIATLQLNNS